MTDDIAEMSVSDNELYEIAREVRTSELFGFPYAETISASTGDKTLQMFFRHDPRDDVAYNAETSQLLAEYEGRDTDDDYFERSVEIARSCFGVDNVMTDEELYAVANKGFALTYDREPEPA